MRRLIALVLLTATLPPATARVPHFRSVRLYGNHYVEAQRFARRFGLQATVMDHGKRMRLQSMWTTIDLEDDNREITLNHLRIFLGEPVASYHGHFFLGQRDVDKLLSPILAPKLVPHIPALHTIALDPGHGGKDTGTRNLRLKMNEKTLTLDVARRLEKILRHDGYRVLLTRHSDTYVDLDQRPALAARAHADLFLSIHFNAVRHERQKVRGAETYILTPRYEISTQPEQKVSRDMIRTRYPGNKFDAWNSILGYRLHRALVHDLKTFDRGLKHRRLAVLRTAPCPAALVEAAYLSNDAEARRLATAAYRQKIAAAIADGIKAYARTLARARP